MSEQAPHDIASVLRQVDEVCQRFEAAWKSHLADRAAAPRPRVEDYVVTLPEADRPLLASELTAVDEGYQRRLEGDTLPPTPPPADDDGIIRVRYFGDYELLDKIASGGFGVVYKARQVSLNRVVALKMIRDGRLATPELVQRFRLEAEAAAGLEHEGIVPVYEVGANDGQHYFSMKLVEGGSLTSHLERFVKDPRSAAKLVADVARAVSHAHQRGVLHRDLKPGNILLDAQGRPQVTDFGLAKLLEGGRRAGGEGGLQTLSGAVVGTPGYLAPEQARGTKGVTTAADIYGLGAVLYELLTGRPPFRADTPMEALLQVLEREPERPRTLDPRVDRDLETVCLKCLEKEPGRRYGTAEAVTEELERWLNGWPIQARPVSQTERLWRWCRRNPAVASLSVGVALSLILGFLISMLFAVRAENQADLARQREAETAVALKRAEEALADGLLRPQGFGPLWGPENMGGPGQPPRSRGTGGENLQVNAFEWQALADLASLPTDQARVRSLFIEQALGSESKAAQLGRPLRPALQAAVGTNQGTRQQVLDLASKAVADESRPRTIRLVATRILGELESEESDLTGRMISLLLQVLLTPESGTDEDQALASLRQLAERFRPATLAIATSQIRELASRASNYVELHKLSLVLASVGGREDSEAARLAATAIARKTIELMPGTFASGNIHQGGLRKVLEAVLSRLDPAPAFAVASKILDLVPRTTTQNDLEELGRILLALGSRWDEGAAASVNRQILDLLPRTTDEDQLFVLAQGVKALASQGNPEATRLAAKAIAHRASELVVLTKSEHPHLSLAKVVFVVADLVDPEVLRKATTTIAHGVMERAPKTVDTRFLSSLAEAVTLLAKPGEGEALRLAAAAVAQQALELVPTNSTGYFDTALTTLMSMAELLDQKTATALARRTSTLVAKTNDANQVGGLLGVVSTVAKKADAEALREAATAVGKQALLLIPENPDQGVLDRLRLIWAASLEFMNHEDPPGVARKTLEFLGSTTDPSAPVALLGAVKAVSGRLDRETATTVVRQTLELVAKTDNVDSLRAFLEILIAVGEKAASEASRLAAAAAVRRILEQSNKINDSHLTVFSKTVPAMAGYLNSESATEVARQVLDYAPKIVSRHQLHLMMNVVVAAGDKGKPEIISRAAGVVLRRILELPVSQELSDELHELQASMAEVVKRLHPADATAVCQWVFELVAKADDSGRLWRLANVVLAVGDKAEPERLRLTQAAIARRARELAPNAGGLWGLIFTFRALQARAPLPPQPDVVAHLGRQILLRGSPIEEEIKRLTPVLDGLLRGASVESLVDLLKHPACVGLMREAVVRELGRQQGRSFRSFWDAVAWLQVHRPEIDLNSPSRILADPSMGR